MLLIRKCRFFVYLDLVKRRLEIMLNDFAEEKRNLFFGYKKHNFSKSKKSTFPKGLTHGFGQKIPIFFVYVDLAKIRLEIMLSDFPQVKRNLFD